MMRMLNFTKHKRLILITATIAWLLTIVADIIAVRTIGRPALCHAVYGGDAIFYSGLGYTITVFYPLATAGEMGPYYSYSYTPCIVGLSILFALIIFDFIKAKRNS